MGVDTRGFLRTRAAIQEVRGNAARYTHKANNNARAALSIYMVAQATVVLRKTTSPIPNTHPSDDSTNEHKHHPFR